MLRRKGRGWFVCDTPRTSPHLTVPAMLARASANCSQKNPINVRISCTATCEMPIEGRSKTTLQASAFPKIEAESGARRRRPAVSRSRWIASKTFEACSKARARQKLEFRRFGVDGLALSRIETSNPSRHHVRQATCLHMLHVHAEGSWNTPKVWTV
eukprot:365424-Chlamydomonas_euryale.AAC.24